MYLGGVHASLSLFLLDLEGYGGHFGLNVSGQEWDVCTGRADCDRVIFFCEDCFIQESVFKSQISFRELFCCQHQPQQLIMPVVILCTYEMEYTNPLKIALSLFKSVIIIQNNYQLPNNYSRVKFLILLTE